MTKLEEKLVELGYVKSKIFKDVYVKRGNEVMFFIYIDKYHLHVEKELCRLECTCYIQSQWHIDNLQQEFNQLQNDLEVLSEYED